MLPVYIGTVTVVEPLYDESGRPYLLKGTARCTAYKKTCPVCGSSFWVARSQRYCSKSCSNRAVHEIAKRSGIMNRYRQRVPEDVVRCGLELVNSGATWKLASERAGVSISTLRERASSDNYQVRRGIVVDELPGSLEPMAAAYMAGFLDGEGTVGVNSATRRQPGGVGSVYAVVRVGNTHQGVIQWLQDSTPWPSYSEFHKKPAPYKDMYHLSWAGRSAEAILRAVFPFLIVKRRQAELALELFDIRRKLALDGGTPGGHGNRLPQWVVERRSQIQSEVMMLNRRGKAT